MKNRWKGEMIKELMFKIGIWKWIVLGMIMIIMEIMEKGFLLIWLGIEEIVIGEMELIMQ